MLLAYQAPHVHHLSEQNFHERFIPIFWQLKRISDIVLMMVKKKIDMKTNTINSRTPLTAVFKNYETTSIRIELLV
jgi:hypothetical protein